jgi:hypothetical protein
MSTVISEYCTKVEEYDTQLAVHGIRLGLNFAEKNAQTDGPEIYVAIVWFWSGPVARKLCPWRKPNQQPLILKKSLIF